MKRAIASRPSAPECQLCKLGTPQTYTRLLRAAQDLSERELEDLEDDITFYMRTGLIGVRMSRMLTILDEKRPDHAA